MLLRDPGDLTPLPAVLPWSEIQPLMVAVNRYIERLRAMVARQQRFSADASHQLRTPLTILKTQVSVALNSQNPALWQESLQGMRDTLDDTIMLTDRLLQLSRIKAMQQHQPMTPSTWRSWCAKPACCAIRRRAAGRLILATKAMSTARYAGMCCY